MYSTKFKPSLILISFTIILSIKCNGLGGQLFRLSEEEEAEQPIDLTTDVAIDFDGFKVDPNFVEETIDESLRSREERFRETSTSTRHPFEKTCPYGYFVCADGECIASRWRCDGHYDCDDFSDELNCTSIDIPQGGSAVMSSGIYVAPKRNTSATTSTATATASSTTTTTAPLPAGRNNQETAPTGARPPTPTPHKSSSYGLDFNSSIEPLMVFSTGSSIRGLWMKSHIYFDVVTRAKPQPGQTGGTQPSITEAFSLFFGLLGGNPSSSSSSSSSSSASSPSSSSASSSSSSSSSPTSSSTGTTTTTSTGKPDGTIVGLDMDPNNKEVVWVELGKQPGVYSALIEDEQFSARSKRQQRAPKRLVEYGLMSPEDVALDTVGRNAYITDAGLPAVVVCSYFHVHCKIIVHDNIHKPRAIITDSATGWITFTDWGDRPGIFLVSMDGRRRETLIETDVVWPNGLAADPTTNSLYWADARLNKIERVDLKSRRREIIIKEISTNPFSVSLFESRIYWSDWSRNEIKTCNKVNGNDTQVILNADDIYGIHIYHPDLHKQDRSAAANDPCWSKHCSHMCLLAPVSATFATRANGQLRGVCACPNSMELSIIDKATCIDLDMPFLLINVRNYIAEVTPDKIGLHAIEKLIYSKEHAIQDIAADWHHYRVYFFDAQSRTILEADYSGRRPIVTNKTRTEARSLRGLTYDWMSDNLYWLDHSAGSLNMYSFPGDFQRVLRKNLQQPQSMVLDTNARVFYIACMDTLHPYILRADVTGNEQADVTLISGSINGGLGLPIALHLDEKVQRLYWADAKLQTIESIDLDVKSRSTGTRINSRQVHRQALGLIVSFTVFQDSFIWTVAGGSYLYKARIAQGRNSARALLLKIPAAPLAHTFPEIDYKRLITISPVQENSASPCQTIGCSHGCQLDSTHDPKCICPDKFKLSINNRTSCIAESVHEECQTCIPAVIEKMKSLNLSHAANNGDIEQAQRHAAAAALAIVPGAGGIALTNIIKHLDGLQTTTAMSPPPPSQSNRTVDAPPPPAVVPLGPPELKKFHDNKHEDWIFDHSLEHVHQPGESAAVHAAAAGDLHATPKITNNSQETTGNKMVWLIVFLLILSAAGLVTVLSLLMLHKQGRLPRQVAVSFIAPGSGGYGGSSVFGGGGGQDKDRTMLLLDTDN